MVSKIYRGGVHRTTPETREVNPPTTGVLLPGTAFTITTAAGGMTLARGITGIRNFFYIAGEPLHGDVDTDLVAHESSVRGYTPRSADLYGARAVAGITLVDDMPLTINSDGRFATAAAAVGETPADPVYAYVDLPANNSLSFAGPTTLDQLIPIKIK